MAFIDISPTSGNQVDVHQLIERARQELDFLLSPQIQHKVLFWKWGSLFVSALFIVLILIILKKDGYDYFKTAWGSDLTALRHFKNFGQKQSQKQWAKIKQRLKKEGQAHYKLALMEAETFLDNVLMRLGLGGDNLDERLKRLNQGDISNFVDLQSAVRLCQEIAANPDYTITKQQAEEKIAAFEKSLTDLNAL